MIQAASRRRGGLTSGPLGGESLPGELDQNLGQDRPSHESQ